MELNELYLKTVFCCMACDGEIAPQELKLLKEKTLSDSVYDGLNIEERINEYCSSLQKMGAFFLADFIKELKTFELTEEQELIVCQKAVRMILADEKIEYNEIAFFKKIRSCLNISDEKISSDEDIRKTFESVDKEKLQGQTIEKFLEPDIDDDLDFLQECKFENLVINIKEDSISN